MTVHDQYYPVAIYTYMYYIFLITSFYKQGWFIEMEKKRLK